MGEPFRHRLRVRYSECDPQGVVFNANYLTYFDVAITELWREAFGGWEQAMSDTGLDIVLAEATVRYLGPLRFDEEFDLVARIARLGNTSITTAIEAIRDGAATAQGDLRHVFVDATSRKPTPMPDSVRSTLERYSG